MRTILTLVFTASVACAADEPLLRFSGSVVDGLDQPIANAAVRVYNGHMGIDTFQIDSEAIVHTDADGRFSGVVTGEVSTTYRIVSKEPYRPVEEFGNWNINNVVRLLEKKEFTTNEVEALMAAQGTALYSNVVDILSKDWSLGRGVWLFTDGDHIRPAVLQALRHPSAHVRAGAKRLLAEQIGHPEDLDFSQDSWLRRHKQVVTSASLDSAIDSTVALILREDKRRDPTKPRRYVNRTETATFAFFTAFATVNGHFADYYLYFSKKGMQWTLEYSGISCIE